MKGNGKKSSMKFTKLFLFSFSTIYDFLFSIFFPPLRWKKLRTKSHRDYLKSIHSEFVRQEALTPELAQKAAFGYLDVNESFPVGPLFENGSLKMNRLARFIIDMCVCCVEKLSFNRIYKGLYIFWWKKKLRPFPNSGRKRAKNHTSGINSEALSGTNINKKSFFFP